MTWKLLLSLFANVGRTCICSLTLPRAMGNQPSSCITWTELVESSLVFSGLDSILLITD